MRGCRSSLMGLLRTTSKLSDPGIESLCPCNSKVILTRKSPCFRHQRLHIPCLIQKGGPSWFGSPYSAARNPYPVAASYSSLLPSEDIRNTTLVSQKDQTPYHSTPHPQTAPCLAPGSCTQTSHNIPPDNPGKSIPPPPPAPYPSPAANTPS